MQNQIFSNANEAHVAVVLKRLGLEDCFEDVICFESLNPPSHRSSEKDGDGDDDSGKRSAFPKTPVVCKPFEEAFENTFKMANINPKKTVSL